MGLINELVGWKRIFVAGVPVTFRNELNIVSGATATDNQTTKQTDLAIAGSEDAKKLNGTTIGSLSGANDGDLLSWNAGAAEWQPVARTTIQQVWYRPAYRAYALGTGTNYGASSCNVGVIFSATIPLTITGIEFYAKCASYPCTIRASIWDESGAEFAGGDVSVTVAGLYAVTFDPAYSIPSLSCNTEWAVSMHNETLDEYVKYTDDLMCPAYPNMWGPNIIAKGHYYYNGALHKPTTLGGTERYPIGLIVA